MSEQPTRPVMVLPKDAWIDELAAELDRRGVADAAAVARASVAAVLERAAGRRFPVEAPD